MKSLRYAETQPRARRANREEGKAMTASEKRAAIDYAKRSINHPKTQLLDLLRRMEDAGVKSDVRKLGAIIGRLEAWQNSK